MAAKLTVQEALQAAIGDYNHWAEENGKDYDPVRAYGELRGIFFNKLIARLKQTDELMMVTRVRYRVVLSTDLACVFSQTTNMLVNLVVPTADSNPDRKSILGGISEASKKANYSYKEVTSFYAPISPESRINNIIESLKSYKK